MKWLISSAALVVIVSCSSPKYIYYFDHPAGSAAKLKPVTVVVPDKPTHLAPLEIEASASSSPASASTMSAPIATRSTIPSTLVYEGEVHFQPEEPLAAKAPAKKMDGDLKRSAIFAGAGIVALIIGGQLFWVLGTLSLLIGLIFGIKWLLRQ